MLPPQVACEDLRGQVKGDSRVGVVFFTLPQARSGEHMDDVHAESFPIFLEKESHIGRFLTLALETSFSTWVPFSLMFLHFPYAEFAVEVMI